MTPSGDWKASLERLDTTLGYTMDNTTLICQEFNSTVCMPKSDIVTTGGGWSVKKYESVRKIYNEYSAKQ